MSNVGKRRGRPPKNPIAIAYDFAIAEKEPDPDEPNGWRVAGAVSEDQARQLATVFNTSLRLFREDQLHKLFRNHVEIFARNGGASSEARLIDDPAPVHGKQSEARIAALADEFRALDRGELRVEEMSKAAQKAWGDLMAWQRGESTDEDVSEEVWIAVFASDPSSPNFGAVLYGAAELALSERKSKAKPNRFVWGLEEAGSRKIKYITNMQATEALSCLVHHKINEGLLQKQLYHLFYGGCDLPLTWDDLRELSFLLERDLFFASAKRLGLPIVAQIEAEAQEVHNHPWVVEYHRLVESLKGTSLGHLTDALLSLCTYLRTRWKCGAVWSEAHIRLCAHPDCPDPAFTEVLSGSTRAWPPPKHKTKVRPVMYCSHCCVQQEGARSARLRRRA